MCLCLKCGPTVICARKKPKSIVATNPPAQITVIDSGDVNIADVPEIGDEKYEYSTEEDDDEDEDDEEDDEDEDDEDEDEFGVSDEDQADKRRSKKRRKRSGDGTGDSDGDQGEDDDGGDGADDDDVLGDEDGEDGDRCVVLSLFQDLLVPCRWFTVSRWGRVITRVLPLPHHYCRCSATRSVGVGSSTRPLGRRRRPRT